MEPFDFESDERAVKAREEYKSLRERKTGTVKGSSDKVERTEDGQSLAQTIAMAVVAIILIILLVLFARWIYHRVHHSSVNVTTTSANNPVEQPSNSSGSSNPQNNSNSSSSGNQNSSSNSSASSSSSKTLTNTGPGNVAAVFAGSAIAAAGLHYIISVRRFNKNDP